MKIDQLRKIIREEVRSAVKEELQEVINEAVKVASTPTQSGYTEVPKNQPKKWSYGKSATLDEMLNATAQEMTSQEYQNIYAGTSDMVSKPNFNPQAAKPNFASTMATQMSMENQGPMPGIDISQLGFVNKAKSVLDAANQKSKERTGVL